MYYHVGARYGRLSTTVNKTATPDHNDQAFSY
ncbi:hypothetical protein Cpin_7172 [Chitinophaga pinensis DSM 2588]|uniref:Uncharacterized protein n=1 Tax=Chitinophaga pinensis (strain ATCC 43595 / DSM 2588 / LMG 13176 / NBRC 15968 / NCIMB 11800 / UQM 2034) TaxID=485918 RepID=A0A979GC36_CHIPD|nr:hypothetical protein Cpin_7172 [Chitinophaga pinensis DSM 2588]